MIGQEFTYTGQRFDVEIEMYYYKNRYYSSDQGRFISRDPIGFHDGMGLYEYVKSRPVVLTDPSGLFCADECVQGEYKWEGAGAVISHANPNIINATTLTFIWAAMSLPLQTDAQSGYQWIVSQLTTNGTAFDQTMVNLIQYALFHQPSIWVKGKCKKCVQGSCCGIFQRMKWQNSPEQYYHVDTGGPLGNGTFQSRQSITAGALASAGQYIKSRCENGTL